MNEDIRLKSQIRFFFVALSLLLMVISVESDSRKLETGVRSPSRPLFTESVVPGTAGCPSKTSDPNANQHLTIKNPSAEYCLDLGYDFLVIDKPDGSQDSICILPGKTICPAWDFLNGKCGQEYTVCAKNGLKTVTLDDGNNPFSKEYAICADENGKLLESVTDMANLIEKKDGQARNDGFDLLAAPPGPPPVYESPDGDLPTSFDWRNYNGSDWMTPVKNQGICGSCWAFSAVGLSEAVTNIASNNPNLDLNLAEQYLVSDCSNAGNCNGGDVAVSLRFIRDNGITDETCFPYLDGGSNGCTYNSSGCDASRCTYASAGECSDYRCTDRCSDWAGRLRKIQSYTYLGNYPAIASMKQALVDHGPLSVYMNMGGSFNASNIYTCLDNTYTNHAVIIVGYNDPGGYWIVKNSWGTSWGTNGYFNVMYDNCAIHKYPYYAVGILSGNPVPIITNLNPSSATAGKAAFTLTANGSNFVSTSVVRWNGSDRLTTFISSTQLTASISASDIASAGNIPVTVFNPTPGGGTSAAVNFTINPRVIQDDFNNAITTSPMPFVDNLIILGATTAADDPTFTTTCIPSSGQRYHTVWYRFTPPASGELSITTYGSDYDTVLGVWTGSHAALVSRACNNDFLGMGLQSQVILHVNADVDYYIEVASYSSLSSGGSLQLNMSMAYKLFFPIMRK